MATDIMDSMQLVANTVQADMLLTNKQKTLPRNQIRRILHKIRNHSHFEEKQKPYSTGLQIIFEQQFRYVTLGEVEEMMSWENFTFIWDVHPVHYLMVVSPAEWVNAGGKFIQQAQNGAKVHDPTAFTMQHT